MRRKDKQTCKWGNCEEDSRARGFCENHYRELMRRQKGVDPKTPHDEVIYKIRIRLPGGTQPYYYSLAKQAWERAKKAEEEGNLEFFGEYHFSRAVEIEGRVIG